MATTITITIANDTVGQIVAATRTYDDQDRMLTAYLDQARAQTTETNKRLPAQQAVSIPTLVDIIHQCIVGWFSSLENAATAYYQRVAVQAAQAQAQKNVVPVTATSAPAPSVTPMTTTP